MDTPFNLNIITEIFPLWHHVKWVLCYHGIARAQVMNGAHGPHMWKVTVNALKKQSRTADKG
jgi:hypothetical protein